MAEVTGAELNGIYSRLSGVSGHHPFDADTVSADWSIEAGDIVKVKRGDETYTSPLHSTSLTWRGAPEMTLSSTGNKERDAIAKVSKRKYSRGGGYLNDQRFYKTFYDAYEGLYSYIEMTSSRLYTTFEGMYDGLSSEFEITRSRMYADFKGMYDGLSSSFEITRSRMYADFNGLYDGLSSQFEVTRSRMYVDFRGMYDGLSSSFEVTRSRMYADFNGLYDGLSSQFEVTRSRMYVDFKGLYDGLGSEFEITRSRMYAEFHGLYDGLSSEFELTRSRMYVDFKGLYDGLGSEFELTRSRMYVDFYGLYDGLSSSFEVTRSRMYADFKDLYDGLSSSFEVTRSRMYVDFSGMYDGLSSSFEVTRSRMYVDFHGLYDGLGSEFELTRSRLYVDFKGLYDGLGSTFEVTRSRMYVDFKGLYDGLGSTFEVTRSRMYTQFSGLYDGLSSSFEVTRSRMYTQFSGMYDGLSSEFEITRSRLFYKVDNYYTNLRSRIIAESDRIGLVVEGTGNNAHIKAAQIVASINDDGTSQTLLSADKIELDGNTLLSGALNVMNGGIYTTGNLQAGLSGGNYVRCTNLKLLGASSSQGAQEVTLAYADVNNMIVKAEVDSTTNTLKLWKKGDDIYGNPSITFSKAASGNKVSGSWSGKTLTVGITPTGYDAYVSTITTGFIEDSTTSPHTFHYTAYRQDNDAAQPSEITSARTQYQLGVLANSPTIVRILNGAGSTFINNTATYTIPLQSKTITNNGNNITPDSGYIGFSSVSVAVPGNISDAKARFNASSGQYYIEAYDNVSGNPVSGSSTTYKLGLSGTKVQVQNASGSQLSSTPEYTIPLQSKTISSNGSNITPDSGYVGFSSVTVAVPSDLSNAKARFNASSGSYYIEAYDNTSGDAISGSSVTYKLGKSGTKVQIQNTSGTQLSSTPEYTIPLTTATFTSNGTKTPSSSYVGYSSVTVNITPTLTPTWSGATLTVSSSPAASSNYSTTIGSGFNYNSSAGTYSIYASNSNGIITATQQQYKLGLSGTKVQIQNASSVKISNTPEYTIPLTTKSIVSNGTYTPGTGYVGLSSVTVDVPSDLPNARTRFGASSGSYYVEAYDNVSGNSISGSSVTYKLGKSGTKVQIQNASGSQLSSTPEYTIPLQSKTISSNGSNITPDSGYVGFSSVTVAVPSDLSNAKARFNASSGSYYIEAYDNTSGDAISGSSTTYKLGLSGTKVQVQNASGSQLSSTPEYTIPLTTATFTSNGTKTPSSSYVGYSSVTVNITPTLTPTWSNGTLTVTSSPSASANIVRTLAMGNVSWNGTTATIPIVAKYGSSGQYSESTGWSVTVTAPTVNVSAGNWTTKGINDSGRAYRTFSPSTGSGSSVTQYVSLAYPTGDDQGNLTVSVVSASQASGGSVEYVYTKKLIMSAGGWSGGKNVVTLKNSAGTISIASLTITAPSPTTPVLSGDWSNGTLTVSSSPAAQANFVRSLSAGGVSWNNNVATVPINATYGSSGQYSESTGWSVTVNASTIYDNGAADGKALCNFIQPDFTARYGNNYSGVIYTSGSNGLWVRNVTGGQYTGIYIPLTENGANASSSNLTEIPDAGITANGNYKFKTGYAGIRYLKVAVPIPSYTRYNMYVSERTQSSDGYHYTFTIGTGWSTPFANAGNYQYLYKQN